MCLSAEMRVPGSQVHAEMHGSSFRSVLASLDASYSFEVWTTDDHPMAHAYSSMYWVRQICSFFVFSFVFLLKRMLFIYRPCLVLENFWVFFLLP
jgi:hypothetical protein